MRYFSTFSGIGGFEVAIHSVFPNAECVGYCEIDKYAIQAYEAHFPSHKNLGNIEKVDVESLPDFDLLVGGSPCQDLSVAKKDRQGLKGDRSKLFFKWLEILEKKQPKYYVLENVYSMSKESKDAITRFISDVMFRNTGVIRDCSPVMIDAALVSAQSRKRWFWCNFPIRQPLDRGIFLKDILEPEVDEKYFVKRDFKIEKDASQGYRVYGTGRKSVTLASNAGGLGAKTGLYKVGCLDNQDSQGKRVYSPEGKSQCLGAGETAGGECGRRTGLYAIPDKSYPIDANYHKGTSVQDYLEKHKRQLVTGCALRTRSYIGQDGRIEEQEDGKANSLASLDKDSMVKHGTLTEAIGRQGSSKEFIASVKDIESSGQGIRCLTPIECARLQCFPDDWCSMLSDTRQYKAYGNAVNVEVVKHIMSELKGGV